jgi:maleylpyruvate isomerase
VKLWSYWRSSASWRVRIALHWKQLPFEYAAVDLLHNRHLEAEHRARSPMAKVPALVLDDGRILTESLAILEYLEETHPAPPLLPRDPYLRARSRMLFELVNSGIQPLQNLSVVRHVKDVLGRDERAWAQTWIAPGLVGYQAAVKETAGGFSVGDQPTFADLALVPQLYHARRWGVSLETVPTLLAIEEACAALPAFAAAHADRQPDARP